jgi:hypothetical protein
VGTALGLFLSPTSGGPFVDLGFPASNVTAVTIDPANPRALWTSSAAGLLLSSDGGHTWANVGAGLGRPETVSSITYLGSHLFASDVTGVFEWAAGSRSWVRSSDQLSVISLAASPDARQLYAASSNGELRALVGGGWQTMATPGTAHLHGGQVHQTLRGVLPVAGRLYAVGTTDGVSASADGGQTWTQLGGDVANRAPGQVVLFHGKLVAATSDGVYQYLLASSLPASVTWWMVLLGAGVVLGALGLALLGLERIRPRIGRRRAATVPAHQYVYERPFRGFDNYMTGVAGLSPPPIHELTPQVVASSSAERFAGVEAYLARKAGEPPAPVTVAPTRRIAQLPAPALPPAAAAERFGGVESYLVHLAGQPSATPATEPAPRVGVPAPPVPEPSPQVWMTVPPVDSAPPDDGLDRTRRLPPQPVLPETRVLRPRRSQTSYR